MIGNIHSINSPADNDNLCLILHLFTFEKVSGGRVAPSKSGRIETTMIHITLCIPAIGGFDTVPAPGAGVRSSLSLGTTQPSRLSLHIPQPPLKLHRIHLLHSSPPPL